ncbi:MAG: S-layer homology domain-containing protein [Hyphomonadaceae bacterium]|nr:S-layer homology domain-containing protein [Clostridia bacterium]
MKKTILAFCMMAIMSIGGIKVSAQAVLFTAEAPTTAAPNSVIKVTYHISNASKLYGYELKVGYSNNVTFKEGKNLLPDANYSAPANHNGILTYASTKMGDKAGTDGSVDLAELAFDVVGSGTIQLTLYTATLTDDSVKKSPSSSMTKVYDLNLVKSIVINTSPSTTTTPAPTPTVAPTATPADTIRPSHTHRKKPAFSDLGGYDWAKSAIEQLKEADIIKGTSEESFSPAENIKRADFILLLVRMLNLTADITENFGDVEKDSYYYQATGVAKALGIIKGNDLKQFEPKKAISRQDMFTLAFRILKLKNKLSSQPNKAILDNFHDGNDVSEYAREGISVLIEMGLVKGNADRINPQAVATRAETAVFIHRLQALFSN